MGETVAPTITSFFSELEDPRSDHTKHHQLIDILTIAIWAAAAAYVSWTCRTTRPLWNRAPCTTNPLGCTRAFSKAGDPGQIACFS